MPSNKDDEGLEMELFEFISKMTMALAWPVVTLIGLILLRRHVGVLLQNITKLKFPGGHAEFRSGLDIVEARTEPVPIERGPSDDSVEVRYSIAPPVPVFERDPFALSANPTGVVMEAWKALESAGRDLAVKNGLKSGFSTVQVFITLEREKLISPSELDAIHELRVLRNIAAHDPQRVVSPEDAARFRGVVEKLIRRLGSASSNSDDALSPGP